VKGISQEQRALEWQQKIMDILLSQDRTLSAKEISALCRLGTSQVWRYLDRMKLAGKVKNISSVSKQGKQKIWSVASPQNNPCEEVKKLIP
jgi:Fe2+ or Zn2+ uptake regulation protein